jgi:hypothetical protein
MELSTLTWAGIPLWAWLLIFALGYGARQAYREWCQDRARVKQVDEAQREFHKKYRWQPRMIGGADCGEWVLKDGMTEID